MRLEFLELDNIRTYGYARVDFAQGVTLFEGDVGSGKSTLLYAIEFALFGLGDLKAGHLLRHGATEGNVKLGFEVDGRKIVVCRRLERKKDAARQAPGWIEEDGVRTDYSPEELKARVLSILQFRENPAVRATSWIFRYAVFTPQEQMKEILTLKSEERLQTLRKAFGVEEYKTAQENAGVLQQRLREKSREIRGQLSNVEELQQQKAAVEKQLAELESQKPALAQRVQDAQMQVQAAEKDVQSRRAESLALEREAAEVPLLQKRVEEWQRQAARLQSDGANLDGKARQWAAELKTLQGQNPAALDDPQKEWEAAQETLRRRQTELGACEHAAREHAALRSGTCPTCGQKISDGLNGKIQDAENALKQAQMAVQMARQAEMALRNQLTAYNQQKLALQKIQQLSEMFQQAETQRQDVKAREAEALQSLQQARDEFERKKHHLQAASDAKANLQQTENTLRQNQAALQATLSAQAASEAKESHLKQNRQDLEAALERKKQLDVKLKDLESKNAWLADPFIPALSLIEEHVLQRINDEFNRMFSRWFVQLLESQDLSAEVDASFTPQIRQQGFEQDFTALSGGEKSALALAYRLALNTLVRQTTPSLKHNLLILDEPTDGFSKEQLGRMRQVLQEAGAQQILLVSHERELEALCDQVFQVEKHGGESRIKEL
ncbi:hypothetical protein HYV43_04995 [Candidatus Micrarchaeota archaeon]|nr:hypothetical protein [Candidatus Micrarchaeota archaeon]